MRWRATLVALGVLIAAVVGWDAGERHYDSCVASAKERVPLPRISPESYDHLPDPLNVPDPDAETLRTGVRGQLQARRRAIDGCSRLPW